MKSKEHDWPVYLSSNLAAIVITRITAQAFGNSVKEAMQRRENYKNSVYVCESSNMKFFYFVEPDYHSKNRKKFIKNTGIYFLRLSYQPTSSPGLSVSPPGAAFFDTIYKRPGIKVGYQHLSRFI